MAPSSNPVTHPAYFGFASVSKDTRAPAGLANPEMLSWISCDPDLFS